MPFPTAGLALTLLLFGPPLLHYRQLQASTLLLALVPPALLLIVARLERTPVWLTHLAFPCAHLPLLVVRPELAGPEVYGGLRGLVALAALLLAAALYLAQVTPSAFPRTRTSRLPVALAIVFGLAPTAALTLAVLTTDEGPERASFALLLGPPIAWLTVGRTLARPRPRIAPTKPRPEMFVAALFLAVVAIAGLAFWHQWSPR
jgi:hypothetical protein